MTDFPSCIKTTGRRKTAVANVEIFPGSGKIQINGYQIEKFFSGIPNRLRTVQKPFFISKLYNFDAKVLVRGGGISGQANALILRLTRSLIALQPSTKDNFRKQKMLTRDSRSKERRKYGLKKARKAPQFSKR